MKMSFGCRRNHHEESVLLQTSAQRLARVVCIDGQEDHKDGEQDQLDGHVHGHIRFAAKKQENKNNDGGKCIASPE